MIVDADARASRRLCGVLRSLRTRRPARLRAAALLALALACASTAHDPLGNRDRHGPRDVGRYIAALTAEERIQELDPVGTIQTLAISEDAVVADLGAGPGVFAVPLGRHLTRGFVFAVDVEPRQLDALRERLRAERIDNVVPVLASPSDPHLPPARLDWILIVDTYHHLEDRVAYLRRLGDRLAPGGRLAILEFQDGTLPVGPPADHKVPRAQRISELQEAGFEPIGRYTTHRYHDLDVWQHTRGAPQDRR